MPIDIEKKTASQSQPSGTRGAEPSASGYITPRSGWPRAATPTCLQPNWAGEFRDFNDWVNFATARLTGTYDPLMSVEVKAICIDAVGRRCTMGGHFMRARDEGTFPVRFFWDCSPALAKATPTRTGNEAEPYVSGGSE